MKNLGIWLDREKAHIVTIENGIEEIIIIKSGIESYKISGGSGTKFKGGPQDVIQDSRYLERENNQFKAYFKDIASQIKKANSIVLFGPAEAAEKLKKELKTNYKDIDKKVKGLIKADSMTDNQIRALVRDFYN